MADNLSPLELLQLYPTMMKWRGTWVETEQYLKNDVVISPLNSSSYILANETASLIPTDPSLDGNWEELSPATVGVTSVNAGAGITVVNPSGPNVTVSNAGVITLVEGTNVLINNLDPRNPIINATTPVLTTVALGFGLVGVNFPAAPADVGSLVGLGSPDVNSNIFYRYLETGSPEPNGIFNIDLTGLNIFLAGSGAVGADKTIEVLMIDSSTLSTPIVINMGSIVIKPTNNTYPFQVRPSTYVINVANVRATGFRKPDQFAFLNNTTATLELNTWGDIPATYYPEGLQ